MSYMPGAIGKASGTTDIDDSVQDESSAWFVLLTIAPVAGGPLRDVRAMFDMAKAVTGFSVVESSATIQLRVARKIDGTNWRGNQFSETTALSGTNAAGQSIEIDLGQVDATEGARIEALMSADATADMEIPYVVYYEGPIAPTVTAVAAG
jgi:hypothetical protein